MAIRAIQAVALCVVLVLAGCQIVRPAGPVVLPDGVVEPLTEAEFDDFAFRVAAKLSGAMSREGIRTPAVLRVPTIAAGRERTTPGMRLFCRTLAEGLADRMGGMIEIAEVTGRAPDLHATVVWPEPAEGSEEIALSIRDERTARVLMEERTSASASRAQTSPTPRRDAPRDGESKAKSPIEIEMRASEIGPYVLGRLEDYTADTIEGDQGQAVFLDRPYRRYFAFESQSITRTTNGITVEVRIRPIRGPEDVLYRVVFYDEAGETLAVTPVTPRKLAGDTSTALRAMTRDGRAARYIFLITRD
ncbi:MAG: hypothetical protein AMXMBFR47_22630 [Planctomycetota bacterium]